jgi:hypothetical protein
MLSKFIRVQLTITEVTLQKQTNNKDKGQQKGHDGRQPAVRRILRSLSSELRLGRLGDARTHETTDVNNPPLRLQCTQCKAASTFPADPERVWLAQLLYYVSVPILEHHIIIN